MTSELYYLAASGALLLVLTLIQGTRNVLVLGLPKAAANPEPIVWEGMNDRLNRSISNLIEALVIFTPLAVVVSVAGLSNETTALGAQLFFFARVAHAVVYIIGLPYIRTGAWAAGVAGIVMVAMSALG